MPFDDDKDDEDLVSSAGPDLDEQLAPGAADDAASSTATGETEDDGLLSVIRDVVGDRTETAEQAASPAEGEEVTEQADAPKEQDDEEYSDVPFHKHPRFQQLLRQKKASEADATSYRQVQSFMQQNGLTAEEAADMLIVAGLMKTNPVEAWRRAQPTIQKLLIAAGEVLPEDLMTRVRAGEMSREAAFEVSRARASEQSLRATRTFEQQQADRRQQSDAHAAVIEAGNSWEADRRAKDPNFDAKIEPFKREMAYIQMQEGKPSSPQAIVDQFNRAYKAVNAAFRAPAPAPAAHPSQQKKPVTPVRGGSVAGTPAPSEMSTLDIVRAHTRA